MPRYGLKDYFIIWFYFLCWCCMHIDMVEGQARGSSRAGKKRSKVRNRNRRNRSSDPFKGWRWVAFLFALCTVPPIASFAYKVYQDPETPTLAANVLEMVKERLLGFLANQKPARRRE